MSLMTEIRSSVTPRDIDQFDDLVLKKEIEIMKVCCFNFHNKDNDVMIKVKLSRGNNNIFHT